MIYGNSNTTRLNRWAMVGGGHGSQIGYIHRSAALRDNNFKLVAGAFDIDPERGRSFGEALRLNPERCYADYRTLFEEEGKRPDGTKPYRLPHPTALTTKYARRHYERDCM